MAIKKQIIYKKLNEIHPYKNNPRFNDEAVEYVKKSIQQFHFQNPIIISTDGEIICGHTRYKACLELGLKEVPCIVADDLTDEQVKAFRLADNKVSEKAEWDFDLLDEELDNILDINMENFGFELNLDDILKDEVKNEKNDSIVYFENQEIRNDIVNNWKTKKSLEEFVSDIIDIPTAKFQFNRLCQGYKDGYNISLLFNPQRLTCPTHRNKGIYYGMRDDVKFRENFARFLVELCDKVCVQSDYYKYIGLGMSNYQYVNEFQPYLARNIYKENCKDGDKILNPCAGWGGRLIGLASCMFKNIEYVETDPATDTYNGLVKLKKFLRLGDNYKQYNLPFEELELKKDYFDFVFTSPPYFDTELYSNEDTQSYKKNNSYELWRDNFLYVMIDKIIYSMKHGAKCILNVGNKRYSISDDIKNYLKEKYNIDVTNAIYELDSNEDTNAIRSSEEDFLFFKKN